jgi:hypothetical protein
MPWIFTSFFQEIFPDKPSNCLLCGDPIVNRAQHSGSLVCKIYNAGRIVALRTREQRMRPRWTERCPEPAAGRRVVRTRSALLDRRLHP